MTAEANIRSWKPSGLLRSFAIYLSREIIVPVVVDDLLTSLSYITYSTCHKLHHVTLHFSPTPPKYSNEKSISSKWTTMHQTKSIFTMINHSVLTKKTMVYITLDQITPTALALSATTHLRHLSNENIPLQQNNRNKAIATRTIVFALPLCSTWTSRKTIFPLWFSYASQLIGCKCTRLHTCIKQHPTTSTT